VLRAVPSPEVKLDAATQEKVSTSALSEPSSRHAAAVYTGLTGYDRGEIGGGTKSTDNPAIGSVLALLRPPRTPVVPYVSMPYVTQVGAGGPPQPGFFGGLLGRSRDPLFVLRDPNAPGFAMPELGLAAGIGPRRLRARRQLLARLPSAYGQASTARELGSFQRRVRAAVVAGHAAGVSARPGAARPPLGRAGTDPRG
jgi:hypothetical protein